MLCAGGGGRVLGCRIGQVEYERGLGEKGEGGWITLFWTGWQNGLVSRAKSYSPKEISSGKNLAKLLDHHYFSYV